MASTPGAPQRREDEPRPTQSLPSRKGYGPAQVLPFPVATQPEHGAPRTTSTDPLSRWTIAIAGACALLVAFVQSPGRIVSDTKLPLDMSPISYMSSALHMWDPTMWSGSIQTLSFGYLFPMGAFFALGHLLHIPVWCTERLWLALLLTTGFWGMVRLAEALGIGNRRGRVLGAVAYVIAPIVVTWAATTAALLAVVLLPWVLVPLVRGSQHGSPRRAAFASGFAVALMGGVNSTVVIATLPLGAVWLLTRQPGERRRSLAGWWIVALVLACFWWAAALAIESRFGYNYLPYTETATVTTATASLFEALRGASFWIDHFTLRGPLVPGAWTLISSVGPILATAVVTALGLAGLVRRIPERLFLVTALAVGVVVIAAGYGGALGGPAASWVQDLIGGPLAELRNVSKFSPDVALPLALGFASITSVPLRAPREAQASGATPGGGRAWLRPLLALVVAAALIAAAAPFWESQLYPRGTFASIPSYWTQTANWLDAHQDHGTALLAPGADFGEYTWGRPLDEPLSVLASSSWSVRSLIPFGSNGNDQVLDTMEASLDQDVAQPRMADYLARAGFDYVVVRNDLDLTATQAPAPAQVRQVMSQTPGLKLVASFGPVISRHQANPSGFSIYDNVALHGLRSVQIYRVEPSSAFVRTYAASDPVVVSGSPSSLLSLLDAGQLEGKAAILAGDVGSKTTVSAKDATWADTDGNQRRDVSFGAIRDNDSYVLGPDQRSSIAQKNVPQNFAVVSGTEHQTVAKPIGAASVTASSFSSTPLAPDAAQGPGAAFDNDRATAWVANAHNDSVGQWAQINFGRSVDLHEVSVRPLADAPQRPTVRAVTISTAGGSVVRRLHPGTNVLTVPRSESSWLRVTLTEVQPARGRPLSGFPLGAGLTSVQIPGVRYVPALRLPADEISSFDHDGQRIALSMSAPVTNANADLGQSTDDDPLLVREFELPAATKLTMVGQATPTPGSALDSLIPPVSASVAVTSSSVLGQLPRFSPSNLVTRSGLPWIAGQGDAHPSVTFRWAGARTVDAIKLTPTAEAARPLEVRITSGAGSAVLKVPRHGGTLRFPPMTTDSLTVHFVKSSRVVGQVPATRTRFFLPVGVAQLTVPVLGQVTSTVSSPDRAVAIPCGKGPSIFVDGKVLTTEVTGTVSDLENLTPMGLVVCGGSVALDAGHHVLEAGRLDGAFKVTSLEAVPATTSPVPTSRAVRVVGPWTSDRNTAQIGAGAAAYLAVAQNYNPGWHASLNGRSLTAVRLDGWEQAWLVPDGSGGRVVMTMPADTWYRFALLLGAAFVALLAAGALVRRGKRDQQPVHERAQLPAAVLAILSFAVLAFVCGPLALVLVPLLYVGHRWGRTPLAFVAAGAFLLAGVAAAASPGASPQTALGAFGWPAQAGAAVAFAAVLAGVIAKDGRSTSSIDPSPLSDASRGS